MIRCVCCVCEKTLQVLLGEGRVGKTSMVLRYVNNTFSDKQQVSGYLEVLLRHARMQSQCLFHCRCARMHALHTRLFTITPALSHPHTLTNTNTYKHIHTCTHLQTTIQASFLSRRLTMGENQVGVCVCVCVCACVRAFLRVGVEHELSG